MHSVREKVDISCLGVLHSALHIIFYRKDSVTKGRAVFFPVLNMDCVAAEWCCCIFCFD